MHITNTYENTIVDGLTGVGTIPNNASGVKIHFFTSSVNLEAGLFTDEISGGGYPAGGITVTLQALSGLVGSTNAFTLTNCPSTTVSHFGLSDGTNLWFWGTYSKTLELGKDLEFTGGEFDMTFGDNFTEFSAGKVWEAFRGNGAYSNPAPRLAGFSADPGTTGTISNELTDTNYARPTPTFAAASAGAASITANAEYGTGFAASATCTHMGLLDNTAAKVIFSKTPTGGSVSIAIADILRSKISEFTVTAQ